MANGVAFREAVAADLPAIVAMLADDVLGATREDATFPPNPAYVAAFEAIAGDPNHMLLVAEVEGEVAGCLQLSFIPGMSRLGMWRGQIEGVRVASAYRGRKIGRAMVEHAVRLSRERGCQLVQLTTDKTRVDAHRFYEGLGFVGSHLGMKLGL